MGKDERIKWCELTDTIFRTKCGTLPSDRGSPNTVNNLGCHGTSLDVTGQAIKKKPLISQEIKGYIKRYWMINWRKRYPSNDIEIIQVLSDI